MSRPLCFYFVILISSRLNFGLFVTELSYHEDVKLYSARGFVCFSIMGLFFVIGQKRSKLLVHNGHLHSIHRVNQKSVAWRCTKWYTLKCGGRVHTTTRHKTGICYSFIVFFAVFFSYQIVISIFFFFILAGSITKETAHCHAPIPAEVKVKKVLEDVRKKARNSRENRLNIVAGAVAGVTPQVSAALPTLANMRKLVDRTRKGCSAAPINPQSTQDLVIPDDYKITQRNEDFLVQNSMDDDGHRLLIFTTKRNLRVLSRCEHWLCDGTFQTVPLVFFQLYTVHGLHDTKTFPLIYILTENKKKQTYIRALRIIATLRRNLAPKRVICDFELAFLLALSEVFPDADVQGCFFHFGQCLWRSLQSLGLAERYISDEDFSLHVRIIVFWFIFVFYFRLFHVVFFLGSIPPSVGVCSSG